ncbi:unnamed protein product [Aspergillus oryzae var. brunneus]|uniref:Unnamed protein product n=1 Tax=Aspergillus oryzae var. brunneus TaxID=332754 RepID=A0ABQ6KGQ8_ASPOZ|nr:unnamed protein product [Aspergillus oryzae var. brunneus]
MWKVVGEAGPSTYMNEEVLSHNGPQLPNGPFTVGKGPWGDDMELFPFSVLRETLGSIIMEQWFGGDSESEMRL